MDPQQKNNGFGPISKRRGKFATIAAGIILVILVLPYVITINLIRDKEENKDDFFFFTFVSSRLMLSFIIGKALQKFYLFCEEVRHIGDRYGGDWWKLLESTFAFSYGNFIFFLLSLFLLLFARQEECTTFCSERYFWLFWLNSGWFATLSFIVGCREPSTMEVSQINEKENKNVADGLAWSYYFGYLKLVLPNLDKRIGKSEEYKSIISKRKLYILLPKNCYTYGTIDNADSRVEIAGNLEDYKVNRGGILERVYRHTVHRIRRPRPDGGEDEPYFLVLEYAAPLITLYDMSENNEAGLEAEQRDEQVVLFYRKLTEILDKCQECRNKYELVPFSGEDNQIADVLVQKISEADVAIEA
ncbi:stimulator of interferon genes protein 2-like [Acropora muricata]|uniref:stimulator of interferon genes protein 2-like n=1 Tax=Acropora muricata TaxID=159855 RepID=UPI0034E4C8E1